MRPRPSPVRRPTAPEMPMVGTVARPSRRQRGSAGQQIRQTLMMSTAFREGEEGLGLKPAVHGRNELCTVLEPRRCAL